MGLKPPEQSEQLAADSSDSATAAGVWRRTDIKSVFVRIATNLQRSIFPLIAVVFGTRGAEQPSLALPLIIAILALNTLGAWVSWRYYRYCIGEDDIRIEKGLISRSLRAVPYDRVQDISLEEALIPRLLGLVEVRFETGAGGADEVRLSYVPKNEGEMLRQTVRARKHSQQSPIAAPDTSALDILASPTPAAEKIPAKASAEAPSEAPAQVLFSMSFGRLLVFGIFEFSLVVFAVLLGILQQLDFLLPPDVWEPENWGKLLAGSGTRLGGLGFGAQVWAAGLVVMMLAFVGLLTGIVRTILRDYGFLLEETSQKLRRRRGLLTRTDTVMPLHRIQALKISTGVMRRCFGWHALDVVSLAQDSTSSSYTVAPFAKISEIAPIATLAGFALPNPETGWQRPSPRQRFDQVLLGMLIPAIPAAMLAIFPVLWPELSDRVNVPFVMPLLFGLGVVLAIGAALRWEFTRYALDNRHFYTRKGWLSPRLDMALLARLQSIEIAQGPLARARGYADLHLGIAGGRMQISGIPLDYARQIRESLLNSVVAVDFSHLMSRNPGVSSLRP